MPQSERTVTLFFDIDEWSAMTIAAAQDGRTTDEWVSLRCGEVAGLEVLRQKIYRPEDPQMMLGGVDADAAGAQLIQKLADDEGVTIIVDGGQRHDGKEFKPRHG